MEFFSDMEPLLRSFWFVAIPASIIFLIQTVMTFMGADAGDGIDADFDSNLSGTDAPFQLFSLRNLINFLLGAGWSGISFYNTIDNKTVLIIVSAAIGVAFVAVFFLLIRQIQRLGEDNSFNIDNSLNKTGTVYIPVPENKTGVGKVQVSVGGSVHELSAITLNERIPTGSLIKIVKIETSNLVVVEKL
ncbi:MAG: serine protease [Chitinophagaceae bacterium]|nr:MAG: serine protease [Chitinophagaceae bacterium]